MGPTDIVDGCIGIIKSSQLSTVNSQQSTVNASTVNSQRLNSQQSVGAVPRVPALLTVNS
ncbi:hypothetical protein [Tychonema sp. LEGE 07203]|uniref:hypothetical protein n=1 Tax=Tychonema sp. LEGE 07203 TaxID=1828671 RepID=UPI00187E928D|nr:hypothetical protein [Tychonema sp. LEGE 07203]MBE9096261.1 hypothetical protein [Tychonema sp. LEGE 07203]